MGHAYPPDLEKHLLGPPPGIHAPFDLEAVMQFFIHPLSNGVRIAGVRLMSPPGESPELLARELRMMLIQRFHDRRPDADQHTWSSFVSIVSGMLVHGSTVDADMHRSLILAVDALSLINQSINSIS